MLNDKEIKRFYEYVESLGLKFPVAAIAKATGFSKGNVSKYLSKSGEPSENFINAVYEKFPISTKNVPTDRGKTQETGEVITREGDFVKAIIALTESNKGLVETNLTVTSTNQVIADTNALLAQKLVDQNPTAIEDRHTFDETVAMVIALRESLIELSAQMKKISSREASQEFHNKVKVAKGRIYKKDSRVDVGK